MSMECQEELANNINDKYTQNLNVTLIIVQVLELHVVIYNCLWSSKGSFTIAIV